MYHRDFWQQHLRTREAQREPSAIAVQSVRREPSVNSGPISHHHLGNGVGQSSAVRMSSTTAGNDPVTVSHVYHLPVNKELLRKLGGVEARLAVAERERLASERKAQAALEELEKYRAELGSCRREADVAEVQKARLSADIDALKQQTEAQSQTILEQKLEIRELEKEKELSLQPRNNKDAEVMIIREYRDMNIRLGSENDKLRKKQNAQQQHVEQQFDLLYAQDTMLKKLEEQLSQKDDQLLRMEADLVEVLAETKALNQDIENKDELIRSLKARLQRDKNFRNDLIRQQQEILRSGSLVASKHPKLNDEKESTGSTGTPDWDSGSPFPFCASCSSTSDVETRGIGADTRIAIPK